MLHDATVQEPTYILTPADRYNVQAVYFMCRFAEIGKKKGLRRAARHNAGIYLRRLRKVEGRTKAEFAEIIHWECGLTLRRAQKLMR